MPRAVRWTAAAMLGMALLLGGCATPLRGELTTFHEWPREAPRSYRLVRSEAQRDSLEHASYEKLLRVELARAGFTESAAPRFEIGFDYRSARQQSRVTELYPAYPAIQPYLWFGSFGRHGGFGFSGPLPLWGPGYYPVERTRIWYDYRLQLQIRDLSTRPPHKVYEGTAVSDGPEPGAAEVLPLLARAIFSDFPGPSGVTRRVEVARDRPPAQ